MMKRPLLLLAAFLFILMTGCSSTGTSLKTPVNPYRYEITIENGAFVPGETRVFIDSTVTWTNKDSVPHSIAEYDGLFKSGEIQPGGIFSYKFDKKGTYIYRCPAHFRLNPTPIEQASVIVE